MSNRNCCIVGCHTTARRCPALSFHLIPKAGKDAETNIWRAELIRAVNRCDSSFNPDKAHICSRHFDFSCLKYGPTGKCSGLVPGSLPTAWMPKKSIEVVKSTRPEPTARESPPVPARVCYMTLDEVRKEAEKSLPHGWIVVKSEPSLLVGLPSDEVHTMKITVNITGPLFIANVKVFGLPAAHLDVDLETKKLSTFLRELQSMDVCPGITSLPLQRFAGPLDDKTSYFQHVRYTEVDGKLQQSTCVRSTSCQLLRQPGENDDWCRQCKQAETLLLQKQERQQNRLLNPLKLNDSLRSVPHAKLKEELKQVRKEKKELASFKEKLSSHRDSVPLPGNLHSDLQEDVAEHIENPLHKMFWEEQVKAFAAKKNGMRWHPMMVRLAILIHSKSAAAYETLRKTGILKLPGGSTLREYTRAVQPTEGFQPETLQELRDAAQRLPQHQRYVAVLHDEMTVKADLVFDSRSQELVGFVGGRNAQHDLSQFDGRQVATHALVFYVVGVNSNIKISLGFFGTRTATAQELFPLFWAAVAVVEQAGLMVVVSTSDKAPANQRLYQLHGAPGEICHKTRNLFALDRWIYFISDPPHLVKTVRNNLASSAEASKTRILWKDGQQLLWRHIADLYHDDAGRNLARTKLTLQHVHLTPHSLMNVRLAAQVLSCRVGKVLREYGAPDRQETATFVLLMDRFFDCLNSRHLEEADRKRKPDLRPYTSTQDARFTFLQDVFLKYLEDWQRSVENRPGHFSKSDRAKMMLSHQTYKGLVMTVRAFIEVTKFLLANNVSYVLANKFCQDPIEEHFGRHRTMGRTADNPNLLQFGYQEQTIRLQRQLALTITPQGNVRGGNQQRPAIVMSTSPLKKKARHQ